VAAEDMSDDLDEERIKGLSDVLLLKLKDNYEKGPPGRVRVYESLNALAIAAATVLAGTGFDHNAVAFFEAATKNQLMEINKELGVGKIPITVLPVQA
jgi:hypothetical protein